MDENEPIMAIANNQMVYTKGEGREGMGPYLNEMHCSF